MTSAEHDNVVHLRGRVSGAPMARQLPSGVEVTSFRIVVARSAASRRRSRVKVDTFDVTAWTRALARRVGRLHHGDRLALTGELRRSFSRSGSGVHSFVGIDLLGFERLHDS